MSQWRILNAITNCRRTAKDVIDLSDLAIYGTPAQQDDVLRRLPERLRALQSRAARLLTALEAEDIR
jgi:hypothetical protein